MEAYRSGHNDHDLKSCVPASIRPGGSNPSASAINYIRLSMVKIHTGNERLRAV